MIYFKNGSGDVYAYPKHDLEIVDRLRELEQMLTLNEPTYIDAKNNFHNAENELIEATSTLENESNHYLSDNVDDAEQLQARNEQFDTLKAVVEEKKTSYNEQLSIFSKIEFEYRSIKTEYDAILPVFFEIRDNLNMLKKMTQKEVNMHLNPPISKEQLITEAEQKKQSLLVEANNAIAPLQDAVDLGMATKAETEALQEWKERRILLNRIDASLTPNIDWPKK